MPGSDIFTRLHAYKRNHFPKNHHGEFHWIPLRSTRGRILLADY